MAARKRGGRLDPRWLPAFVVGLAGVFCADVPPPAAASDGSETVATGTFWLDLETSPDLDGDGTVDENDLVLLVTHWEAYDPELLALLVAEWGVEQ